VLQPDDGNVWQVLIQEANTPPATQPVTDCVAKHPHKHTTMNVSCFNKIKQEISHYDWFDAKRESHLQ